MPRAFIVYFCILPFSWLIWWLRSFGTFKILKDLIWFFLFRRIYLFKEKIILFDFLNVVLCLFTLTICIKLVCIFFLLFGSCCQLFFGMIPSCSLYWRRSKVQQIVWSWRNFGIVFEYLLLDEIPAAETMLLLLLDRFDVGLEQQKVFGRNLWKFAHILL